MAANEIHKGDIGTVFVVTVQDGSSAVDVSGATTKQVLFRKPDGTVVANDAEFTTDGTDGKIQYTSVADDLDTVGQWHIQARVTLPAGTWRSDVGVFQVHENLE